MKRILASTLGLALGMFGLALLLDILIVRRASADPIVIGCACQTPNPSEKTCHADKNWVECPSQGEASCKSLAKGVGAATAIQFFDKGKIPDGCIATTDKVNCGFETINCYKKVWCKWNDKATPPACEVDTANDTGQVTSAEKRKSEACAAGAKCIEQ